jgi:hypothetical protein
MRKAESHVTVKSEPATLRDEITKALKRVVDFAQTEPFRQVLSEMMSIPPHDRAQFVLDVWLSPAQLRRRGLDVPDDLIIQRSAFGDDRPTLFCVTKHLPKGLGWSKVTVTIDNSEGSPAVSYSQLAGLSS